MHKTDVCPYIQSESELRDRSMTSLSYSLIA
jgi:hypothetical protein